MNPCFRVGTGTGTGTGTRTGTWVGSVWFRPRYFRFTLV